MCENSLKDLPSVRIRGLQQSALSHAGESKVPGNAFLSPPPQPPAPPAVHSGYISSRTFPDVLSSGSRGRGVFGRRLDSWKCSRQPLQGSSMPETTPLPFPGGAKGFQTVAGMPPQAGAQLATVSPSEEGFRRGDPACLGCPHWCAVLRCDGQAAQPVGCRRPVAPVRLARSPTLQFGPPRRPNRRTGYTMWPKLGTLNVPS
ncbi:hypothetical protein AAFF_G00170040 [Aldrovandia affinis]|uniref:Uncharacterized protein n=1 Tax=Aldrovandia affinis TaxID=143900 RepID=A0AAD7W894_9TELE|nr:hypothetical protein AAFF_G00170040 [Aldrovandia affinis]